MSILAVSCIFDTDSCTIPANEQRSIRFTVSLNSPQSRASWGDDYPTEQGVPFDYRILPEQLRAVVIASDGTRLGTIAELDYWPINESHTQYQFVGLLPDEFVEHLSANNEPNYKFMVLANCSDNMSGEEYITYSHTQLDPAGEQSAIPMWGIKEANATPLYTRNTLDIGDISLLRAAAKIEVKLSDKVKSMGTTINAATLKYYNQTGYVLPSGWSQVGDTKNLDQESCVRVYRHAALNLPFVKDEQTGSYYVYVTEYDNINYSGERNKISLEFTVGGQPKRFEDAISFCQYSNGAPVENSHYNIVRNHIYEFEILSIAGSNLILDYTVANWTTEDWGSGEDHKEHDLSYPTYHNPVVPYDYLSLGTQQANYVIRQSPEMYFGGTDALETGAFRCYFQILAPADVQWKPGFMGSKENYQIRVYRVDKNLVKQPEVIFDSGKADKQEHIDACGAGEWFEIVVFPLSNDGAESTDIEFGISYYQQWTDQYINLYVNGEYGNIRWPNSGDNPKIIRIRHTSQKISS